MTHPRQLPSMKAQGVGLSDPSVPMEMAWRTEWRGAENMMLATMHPKRGQMYSRIMTDGVGILEMVVLLCDTLVWMMFFGSSR